MTQDRKASTRGEWAALGLVVVCLLSALGSIVALYHRVHSPARVVARQAVVAPVATEPAARPAASPTVVALTPTQAEAPPKPPETAAAPPPMPVPAPVPPVDPTVAVLARLTAAEAEQLLAASQSNRQAQALEDARRMAEVESERQRRRRSLINAQLGALESRVRQSEAEVAALALERDALERERDARKAAVARAQNRPGQAILPHKGPNGTWRRPIVVECRNGGAVIRPRGLEFGLLDLESDLFGMANPFVSAVALEAARVQRQATPDGAPAVPYVFFLVRPDGIRPYYEARGRLESLGVTFGYELADQDWAVDFPDLDDVATWDGSPSTAPARSGVGVTRSDAGGAGRSIPGTNPAEDEDLLGWPGSRAQAPPVSDPFRVGGLGRGVRGGSALSRLQQGGQNPRAQRGPATEAGPHAAAVGSRGADESGRGAVSAPSIGTAEVADPPRSATGASFAPVPALSSDPESPAADAPGGQRLAAGSAGGEPSARPVAIAPPTEGADPTDPAQGFVFRAQPNGGADRAPAPPAADPSALSHNGESEAPTPGGATTPPEAPGLGSGPPPGPTPASSPANSSDRNPPVTLPSARVPSRPLPSPSSLPDLSRIDPSRLANLDRLPPPPPIPLPTRLPIPRHLPTPREAGAAVERQLAADRGEVPAPPRAPVVDRTFEIVVVCGPDGVIVQPGNNRITPDALQDREGLFKQQIVGLVKARRAAHPGLPVEPRLRFLVQPGGAETYRTARSQFFVSGLSWPTATQVADPDPLVIRSRGVW